MSAYMIDRNHVRYLVGAAMSRRIQGCSNAFRWRFADGELYGTDTAKATELGQMLWDENRRSIEHRYPDTVEDFDNAPGPIDETYIYSQFQVAPFPDYDPVQVIKACHCYEYQACEHPGWAGSEAKAVTDALLAAAVRALPGYEDAEWGAPEPSGAVVLIH